MLTVDYADILKNPKLLANDKAREFFIYCDNSKGSTAENPIRALKLAEGQLPYGVVLHTDATTIMLDNVNAVTLYAPIAQYISVEKMAMLESIDATNTKVLNARASKKLRDVAMPKLEGLNAENTQIRTVSAPDLIRGKIVECPYLMAEPKSLRVMNNIVFSPAIHANKLEKTALAFYNLDKECYAFGTVKAEEDPVKFMQEAGRNLFKPDTLALFVDQIEASKMYLQRAMPQGTYRPSKNQL